MTDKKLPRLYLNFIEIKTHILHKQDIEVWTKPFLSRFLFQLHWIATFESHDFGYQRSIDYNNAWQEINLLKMENMIRRAHYHKLCTFIYTFINISSISMVAKWRKLLLKKKFKRMQKRKYLCKLKRMHKRDLWNDGITA